MKKRTNNFYRISRNIAFMTMAFAIGMATASCGKKDLVHTISDAITALKAGLEIADSAHQNGFLDDDGARSTLQSGAVASTVLRQVNEFAAQFPDGTQPTEDQKQMVIAQIKSALDRLDALIASGALIKNKEGQQKYLQKVREARALVNIVLNVVNQIKTVKPMTMKPASGVTSAPPAALRTTQGSI